MPIDLAYGTPAVSKSVKETLLPLATLTADDDYRYTNIINVAGVRRLLLLITVNHAAIGGEVSLLPLVAFTDTPPAAGDDSWFSPLVTDGSFTSAVLNATSALPAGADYTGSPVWNRASLAPAEYRLRAATVATDKQRGFIALDVTGARYFQVAYADLFVGTKAALGIEVVTAI